MQNAQLRRQTVPQQAQQAPRPQAEATTRPQQWLKASPRPQQWLLIGVPGCRLTGLKRSKPSKSPPSSAHPRMQNAQLRRQKVPQQAQQAPRRSKPQTLQKSAQLRRQKVPQQAQHAPLPPLTFQTLQTLDKSAQLRREKVPQQAQHAPLPHAKRPTSQANGTPTSPTGATPAGKSHRKATAMAQGIPPAAAMASYRRSRLPFDRLQTLKTLKMPRRPFACIALCC